MKTKIGDFVKICREGGRISKNKFLVVGSAEDRVLVRKDSRTSWVSFWPESWIRVAAPVRKPKK